MSQVVFVSTFSLCVSFCQYLSGLVCALYPYVYLIIITPLGGELRRE